MESPTVYRVIATAPDRFYVQKRWGLGIISGWTNVRSCFFEERKAIDYLDRLLERKYPRVIRTVTIES